MLFVIFILLLIVFVVLPLVGWAIWLVISTIFVGLIVGAIGRLIVPGHNPIGFWATVACGLVGSIGGGALGRNAFHVGGFATILIEIAVAAAAVLVWSGTRRGAIRS